MLLAIDTATRWTGIALYDDRGLHVEHCWRTHSNHTVELMPTIVGACEQQGLTPQGLRAVCASLGPGSFTGLRVGLSVAKGLALALQIPILGVPTLEATAYAYRRELLPVCAVLPAGRGRWCTARFETVGGQWRRQGDYQLLATNDLVEAMPDLVLVCGEISDALRVELSKSSERGIVVASPAASARRPAYLAEMGWARFTSGESDDLASLAPIYLQQA